MPSFIIKSVQWCMSFTLWTWSWLMLWVFITSKLSILFYPTTQSFYVLAMVRFYFNLLSSRPRLKFFWIARTTVSHYYWALNGFGNSLLQYIWKYFLVNSGKTVITLKLTLWQSFWEWITSNVKFLKTVFMLSKS